jgi:predicted transcriptional regulator
MGRRAIIDVHGLGDTVIQLAQSQNRPPFKKIRRVILEKTGRSVTEQTVRNYLQRHREKLENGELTKSQESLRKTSHTLETITTEPVANGRASQMLEALLEGLALAREISRDQNEPEAVRCEALRLSIEGAIDGHYIAVRDRVVRAKVEAVHSG